MSIHTQQTPQVLDKKGLCLSLSLPINTSRTLDWHDFECNFITRRCFRWGARSRSATHSTLTSESIKFSASILSTPSARTSSPKGFLVAHSPPSCLKYHRVPSGRRTSVSPNLNNCQGAPSPAPLSLPLGYVTLEKYIYIYMFRIRSVRKSEIHLTKK